MRSNIGIPPWGAVSRAREKLSPMTSLVLPARFNSPTHRPPRSLTLSEAARKHIRERHPEVSRYEEWIKETLGKPEVIFKGYAGRMKAVKCIDRTHLGSKKYLVVVYREEDDEKAIITAYFTSNLKRVKGEVVWKA